MDRIDYLKRDSFYSGVSEGEVNTDRLITMLNVKSDELVIEEKGIYSVEQFIIARRLMYWQVYLHKTVLSAENLLVNILKRAKELAQNDAQLFATPAFKEFLYNKHDLQSFIDNPKLLKVFADLDDIDIMASIKIWKNHSDKALSKLCQMLIDRDLFKIKIQRKKFDKSEVNDISKKIKKKLNLNEKEITYFVFQNSIINNAYNPEMDNINILLKNGDTLDIKEAADTFSISALATPVKKWFICFPKH
jgi:HD superfamily phosphohydrolase